MRVLLFLALLSIAGHANAQQAQPGWPVTIVETPDQAKHGTDRETKSDAHDAADLDAQVRAASAAERSLAIAESQAIPALVQIAIGLSSTAIAVIALVVSLWTAISGIRTNRAQTRAYVHVDKAELTWGDNNGRALSIILTAQNSGQTPAMWFEVKMLSFIRTLQEDGFEYPFDFKALDFADRKAMRWNALGGQGTLSFSSFNAVDYEAIKAAYGRKDRSVNVAGIIRYKTFFGEIFETEFWFTRRPVPQYIFVDTGSDYVNLVSITRGHEKRHLLQRASCALRTYDKV